MIVRGLAVLSVFLLMIVRDDPCVASDGFDQVFRLRGHERWVLSISFSADDQWLFSGGDDQSLRRWNLSASGKGSVLKRYDAAVTAVACSPIGDRVAVGTWNGRLEVLHGSTGERLQVFDGHSESIKTLSFDASGRYLASGSSDDTLTIWDASNGDSLQTYHQGNEYDVNAAAFHPRGNRLITGDGENQLKVWDTETGDEIETLQGHDETVTAVAYRTDGQIIASASWDDTVRLWNASTGKLIHVLRGHKKDITAIRFFPGSVELVSASEDHTVRIWDTQSHRQISILRGHDKPILCLAVSSSAQLIASGSHEQILVWKRSGTRED